MGYQDGRPYFEETPPAAIEQNIKYLSELRSYLVENCTVCTIPVEFAAQISLPDEIRNGMEHLSITTALVAKHTKTSLYADDASFRAIANQLLQVDGFWSQVFLYDAEQKQLISKEQYADACAKLLKASYFFVSVNKDLIISLLERAGYTTGDEKVGAILSGLKGPDVDENLSIKIAAETLKQVWLSVASLTQKQLIFDAVLRNLCVGRSIDIVIRKLAHILKVLLFVAPLQLDELIKQIALFYEVNKHIQ